MVPLLQLARVCPKVVPSVLWPWQLGWRQVFALLTTTVNRFLLVFLWMTEPLFLLTLNFWSTRFNGGKLGVKVLVFLKAKLRLSSLELRNCAAPGWLRLPLNLPRFKVLSKSWDVALKFPDVLNPLRKRRDLLQVTEHFS